MYSAKYIQKKIREIDKSKVSVLMKNGYYDGMVSALIEVNGNKHYTSMIDQSNYGQLWYRKYAVYEITQDEMDYLYIRQFLWMYTRASDLTWDERRPFWDPIMHHPHERLDRIIQYRRPIFWYKD
jgi:hypothetical protein